MVESFLLTPERSEAFMSARMVLRLSLVLGLVLVAGMGAQAADSLDGQFAGMGQATPGCAVGIERPGQAQGTQPQITRAYGMADLEHNVPNTAATIFEAGSISKQFTAAAILTLAAEHKLALSDDIRKYLPEMPAFGVTVDELLSHTSGLRDWGSEEELAGWPRTDRVYDLASVLASASRQRALNYAPGTHWSYTNTGYNLAAIIVQRVSGQSLADFTKARFFTPLGMSHTSWRDDFRRIVPGRAIAYEHKGNITEQLMPFENAYGNGGLLTNVSDLLIWNRALTAGKLGPFVTAKLQEAAKLKDGRTLEYARGLFLDRHHGLTEISHSGSTAGYSAWLARYPDNGLSVAILCNGTDALPNTRVMAVENLYLPKQEAGSASSKPPTLAEWYADSRDGSPLHIIKTADGATTGRGVPVTGFPGGVHIGGLAMTLLPNGRLEGSSEGDDFERVPEKAWTPGAADLTAIAGRYRSDEAQAVLIVAVKDGRLAITPEDRPSFTHTLAPAYTDAFASGDMTARIRRDAKGGIDGLILSNDRVWALPFERMKEPGKTTSPSPDRG
jgi:CubicO group peptidase (beta-lactamase class C family)